MLTQDKCNVCGWTGDSDDVPYDEQRNSYNCPVCGSEDLDDINEDPYEEDDDEGNWLFI